MGRSGEKEETMQGRLSTWLGTIGAIAALVLVGAAAAQAGDRPDDRAGMHSVDGLALYDAQDRLFAIADPEELVRNEPGYAPASAPAAEENGRPAGMSAQEWKAEQIRGEALDKLYSGGAPEGMTPAEYRAMLIRGEALDKLYGGGAPEGMTPAQYRAELIRGEGLNKLYGLGEYAGTVTRTPAGTNVAPQAQPVASNGFDWGDAGIGAGAGIGFLLLAAGIGVATRQARRPRLTTTG
jgi:hypothetical protein